MILHINYLHRELTQTNNGYRTVINDAQRVWDNYCFELEYDVPAEEADDFKAELANRIISIYSSHRNDSISFFLYPNEDINCFSFRFDDENEAYDDPAAYYQYNGRGWKYYQFPPIGKRDESHLVNPRTILDGLLKEPGEYEILSLRYKFVNEFWSFIKPKADGEYFKAESLVMTKPDKELTVNKPRFAFPYRHKEGETVFRNRQCTDFETSFVLLLSGNYEYNNGDEKGYIVFNFSPRRLFWHDHIMNVLKGYARITIDKFDETVVEYTGQFYTYFSKCSIGLENELPEWSWFLPIGLCPLTTSCYKKNYYDDEGEMSVYYSFFEEISFSGTGCYSEDVWLFEAEGQYDPEKYYIEYARGEVIRSMKETELFELRVFDKTKVKFLLTYFDNEDDVYNWTLRYESEKTVLKTEFSSKKYLEGGPVLRHIRVESSVGGKTSQDGCISAEFSVDPDSHRLNLESLQIDNDRIRRRIPVNIEEILSGIETDEELFDYFENGIYNAFAIVSDNDSSKASVSESKPEAIGSEIISGGNPRLDSLRFFLRQPYKERNLSFSESTMHEIAVSITEWLPIMDAAKNAGKSVKQYIEDNPRLELPDLPNLAIMGEAGTGKTTMVGKLATACFGAKFLTELGSNLKGAYIGWTRCVLAKKIFELQKNLRDGEPAILFIDEAYSLFEQNKNGANSAAEVVELLLKCAEGDCTLDISDIGDKDLTKAGLVFFTDDISAYEDEDCFEVKEKDGHFVVIVKKVVKNRNTVLWLGGYEDRLRKSFQANEGLNRRFASKIIIPTPKMQELLSLFRDGVRDTMGSMEGRPEKEIKNFLTWSTSRSRSALFGNYAGVLELIKRCKNEFYISGNKDEAVINAVKGYKDELTRQYKIEVSKDLDEMPFEVVTDIDTTLDDYAGNAMLKQRMKSIIDMMLNSEEYKRLHITLPKGALLMGPPGTGKTMIARCMAGELTRRINEEAELANQKDVPFIPTSAAEILSTQNPVKAISLLFSEASAYDAAVIFIDEIDAIGKKREYNGNVSALTQLMKELDGFSTSGNVFVIAATNDPDSLDDALVREGRFDVRLEVGYPDKIGSEALIKLYLNEYNISFDELSKEQKDRVVRYLGGRAPAFVKANLNQAAILYHQSEKLLNDEAVDEKEKEQLLAHRRLSDGTYRKSEEYTGRISDFDLFLTDLKEAIDISEVGVRRNNASEDKFDISPDTNGSLSSTAIHEVGHALVGLVLGCMDIERITILGRGDALGYVEHKRDENRLNTRADYLNRIKICMGGRVAEELIYGFENVSPGAVADIAQASSLARNMVNFLGFSKEIGFMNLARRTGNYLGQSSEYIVSNAMREKSDIETAAILDSCMEETRKILSERKDLLIEIARKVFEEKELTGDEIESIYNEKRRDR